MLVDPKSETSQQPSVTADDKANRTSTGPKLAATPRAKGAMLLLFAALPGAGAYRLLADSPAYSEPSPVVAKAIRPLVRLGDSIMLPEGSPIRRELAIEPVAAKDIKRDLILPAVVQADPSHLIKVLPPLAGRVTQL